MTSSADRPLRRTSRSSLVVVGGVASRDANRTTTEQNATATITGIIGSHCLTGHLALLTSPLYSQVSGLNQVPSLDSLLEEVLTRERVANREHTACPS